MPANPTTTRPAATATDIRSFVNYLLFLSSLPPPRPPR
ncbi:hypothetical protein ABIB60_000608 [Hymenobacter sp. UYP22]